MECRLKAGNGRKPPEFWDCFLGRKAPGYCALAELRNCESPRIPAPQQQKIFSFFALITCDAAGVRSESNSFFELFGGRRKRHRTASFWSFSLVLLLRSARRRRTVHGHFAVYRRNSWMLEDSFFARTVSRTGAASGGRRREAQETAAPTSTSGLHAGQRADRCDGLDDTLPRSSRAVLSQAVRFASAASREPGSVPAISYSDRQPGLTLLRNVDQRRRGRSWPRRCGRRGALPRCLRDCATTPLGLGRFARR